MCQDDPKDLKLNQLQFLCCKSALAAGSGTTFSSPWKQLYRPCSPAAWRASSLHPSQLLLRCQYWASTTSGFLLPRVPQDCSPSLSLCTQNRDSHLSVSAPAESQSFIACTVQATRCSFLHLGSFTLTLPGQGNLLELALSLPQFWGSLHSTRAL